MFVKPAPGLVIRDPDLLDLLPDDGRDVPDSGYWQRRVRDNDVVEATPAATSSVAAAPIDNQSLKGDD
jgi:hypothetical protein